MPVALLNYLDRQMLASMQGSVMDSIPSLGLAENREELWGFMLGQFKWVYAAFSLVGGYLADRFSRRLTIAASLFVWSAVTWWTGQVETYDQLLRARSLMGISEAFYIPAALALVRRVEVRVGAATPLRAPSASAALPEPVHSPSPTPPGPSTGPKERGHSRS